MRDQRMFDNIIEKHGPTDWHSNTPHKKEEKARSACLGGTTLFQKRPHRCFLAVLAALVRRVIENQMKNDVIAHAGSCIGI